MNMAKSGNSYGEERKFDPGNIIEFAKKKRARRQENENNFSFYLMFSTLFSSLFNPLIIRLVVEEDSQSIFPVNFLLGRRLVER